jgi:hypothetical protein
MICYLNNLSKRKPCDEGGVPRYVGVHSLKPVSLAIGARYTGIH